MPSTKSSKIAQFDMDFDLDFDLEHFLGRDKWRLEKGSFPSALYPMRLMSL